MLSSRCISPPFLTYASRSPVLRPVQEVLRPFTELLSVCSMVCSGCALSLRNHSSQKRQTFRLKVALNAETKATWISLAAKGTSCSSLLKR